MKSVKLSHNHLQFFFKISFQVYEMITDDCFDSYWPGSLPITVIIWHSVCGFVEWSIFSLPLKYHTLFNETMENV